MDSTERTNTKKEKKSVDLPIVNLQEIIPMIVHQSLNGVRKDIQSIQEFNKDLQLMMRGIHAEIQELRKVALDIGRSIEQFVNGREIKKSPDYEVGEITTGLDLVTKIPHHLRRTFQIMLQLDEATAKEVSLRTGKSRPLESDYLNQLFDRDLLKKKYKGKQVYFYYKRAKEEEEEATNSDPDDFIAKKMEVINASNSSEKKVLSIETLEE